MCLTYGGNFNLPKSRSALYRFYCISRRVALNAASFGISVRSYACNILRYYERKNVQKYQKKQHLKQHGEKCSKSAREHYET